MSLKRDRRLYDLLQNVARNLTALSAAISEIVDLEREKDKKHEESSTSEVEEEVEEKPKKRQRAEKEDNLEEEIAGIFDKEELDAIEASLADQDWQHLDDFLLHIVSNKIVNASHSKEKVRKVAQVFYGVWDYERNQKKKKKTQQQKPQSKQPQNTQKKQKANGQAQ